MPRRAKTWKAADAGGGEARGDDDGDERVDPPDVGEVLDDGRDEDAARAACTGGVRRRVRGGVRDRHRRAADAASIFLADG
mmetsp:Transcript_13383/g.53695  ORF Transcript_13383/g.53695 Transcript_13383/m.53695 type:complete len:81 (+) Transcript_13383:708-950(+)